MSTLAASVQELFEQQREDEWRRLGVPAVDIELSRLCGMDARDIHTLRKFTAARNLMIIVRSPKLAARVWHGALPPKSMAIKDKTGTAGVVERKGLLFVSDYDLMSIWRRGESGYEKISTAPLSGRDRGAWSKEAQATVSELNRLLVSRIQHGCQDDFDSGANPGVKPTDHFMAFDRGSARYQPDPHACKSFYSRNALPWPYSANGTYQRIA